MSGPTVVVSVLGDAKKFKHTMDGISKSMSPLKRAFAGIGKIIGAGLVIAGGAFATFLALSVKSAANMERLNSQTKAVLKSTKSAAGLSLSHLNKVSDALEKLTGKEQESVIEAQNLLLTFTNIKGQKTFDGATVGALDLATAMGTDTKSAAILLGKALNDPVKGITALTRVGVSFSQKQKDVIAQLMATGQTAKAQAVILAEINKEFGGSAKAFGETFVGAWAKVKNSFGQLGEDIVSKLSGPATLVLQRLNTLFVSISESGQLTGALKGVGALITKLAGFIPTSLNVQGGLQGIIDKFRPFLTVMTLIGPPILAVSKAVGKELVSAITQLTPPLVKLLIALLPLLPPLVKLAVAIVPPLVKILSILVPVLVWLVNNGITPTYKAFALLIGLLSGDTSPMKFLAQAQKLGGYFNILIPIVNRIAITIVGPFRSSILTGTHAVQTFGAVIATMVGKFASFSAGAQRHIVGGIINIVNSIRGIGGRIGNLAGVLFNAGANLIRGFLNGAGSVLRTVAGFFASRLPAAIRGPFMAAMGMRSPSKLFAKFGKFTVQGLIEGGKSQLRTLRRFSANMAGTMVNGFKPPVPLNGAGAASAGIAPAPIINIYGGLSTTSEIGRMVSDAFDEWQRKNGKR